MVSYEGKISNVFVLTPSYSPNTKVEKILSGPGNPPTQGSFGHMAPTLIVKVDAHGNKVRENRTSNNAWLIYDFAINGYAAGENSEGVARGQYHFPSFDNWRFAAEGRNVKTFISLPERPTLDSILIVGFKDELSKPSVGQPPLKKYVTPVILGDYPINNYPINKVGLGIHVAGSTVQDVKNYLSSRDGQELLSLFGAQPEEIGYVGYVRKGLPEGVTYAVTRAEDGKLILFIDKEAFNIIARVARAKGVSPKDLKSAILGEEFAHIGLGHIDDFFRTLEDKEIEGKLTVAESYENQERDAASGNPNKAGYVRARERSRLLKKFMEEQAASVPELYSDIVARRGGYSRGNARRQGLEKLIETLRQEAKELGVDEGEYISTQLARHPIKYAERKDYRKSDERRGTEKPEAKAEDSRDAPQEADSREPASASN